ncbi:hypothetical protein E4T38_03815 [Aureobasidium subglaciale]|nr:hypothetical protein E4T38_03815 [Aureobasidium subglaciale]KAI5225159.1 hypothetical protein E4T40_03590 [Aureobasidium subglaciale]KAI5228636.1 hypothetical protein E4T41_03655 [Aureobasidium subglaciale]KAI5263684.1 hypothetical protein E4T46_03431 [Aureobasidium subglaciale]
MDSFNRFVAEHAEEDSRVFTQALNMFGIASDGYLNNVKDHVTKLAKDFDIKVREPQCAQSSSGPDHSARLQATLESEVHRAELLEQKLMVKEELLNKSLIHTRDLEHRLDQEQRQNCKLLDNYRKEYSRSLELAQRLNKKVEAAWFVQEQINEAGQIETTLVKELADTRADIEDLEEEDTLREATISDFVCWVHTAGHKALHQALNKFWEHISSDLLDHERETDHYNEELPVPSSQVGSIPKDSAVADNVDNLTGSHDDSERCSSNDSTFTTFRKWISARIARSQASECLVEPSSLEFRAKVRNYQAHESKAFAKHQLVRIKMPKVVVKDGGFPRERFEALKKKHENDERKMFAQREHDCPPHVTNVDGKGEIIAGEVTESRFERRIRLTREAKLAQAESRL